MVSSGTNLEKSRKNKISLNWIFSGLYVTMQIINLKTDSQNSCITIFWNTKTPFYRKPQQRLKEIYLVKHQPQEEPQKSHKKDVQKHFQIHWSNFAAQRIHAMNYFASLALFMYHWSGMQDAEERKSLHKRKQKKNARFWHSCVYTCAYIKVIIASA